MQQWTKELSDLMMQMYSEAELSFIQAQETVEVNLPISSLWPKSKCSS